MTRATGDTAAVFYTAAGAGADDTVRQWEAVRANSDIQFAPVTMPEPAPPPEWLMALLEFLGRIFTPVAEFLRWVFTPVAEFLGLSWPVFKLILIGLAVLALLFFVWRLIEPILRIRRARKVEQEEAKDWAPDRHEAITLLEDADKLAAEGRYDEAAHLLLLRSVEQIAAARSDWLEPSSTAREIAGLPALPENARSAFAIIASHVERSLFALRRLEQQDWKAARSAYADFALAGLEDGLEPAE